MCQRDLSARLQIVHQVQHGHWSQNSLILMEFSVALLDILISDIRYCVSAPINDIHFMSVSAIDLRFFRGLQSHPVF